MDFDFDEPRDLGGVTHAAGWTAAYKGLRIYYTAIIIQIVLMVVSILLMLALKSSPSRSFAELYVVATSLGGLAVGITALVGLARYVRVPVISGGQGLAVAALVFAGINLVISLVQNVQLLTNLRRALRQMAKGQALSLVTIVAGIAMLITFVVSMRKVAAFIGRPEIEARAGNVLTLIIIILVVGVLMVVVALGARGGMGAAGFAMVLSFVLLGLAIWMLVAYLSLINALSSAIQADVGIEKAFD